MPREQKDQDAEWLGMLEAAIDDRAYASLRSKLDAITPELAHANGWDEAATLAFRNHSYELGPDSLLQALFADALKRLPESRGPLDLYFIQIGAATLNGFALKAPSGTPVIVLNHGLISYVGHAVHITLGLTGMEPPLFCPHHPPRAFLRDLETLANGLIAGVPALLLPLTTPSCLIDHSESNLLVHHSLCLLAEYFVIFHELGHLLLGHLDPARTRAVAIDEMSESKRLEMFERSHHHEAAADLFAFQRINEMATGTALRCRDVAYAVGCLFVLMHAAEQSPNRPRDDNHPPAAARWARIRALLPPDEPGSWTKSIDYLLEYVSNELHAPPTPNQS